MTLDNMTGITKGSWTVDSLFCKSQLITCNRVKECNGVCPFEDALKHADKEMDEQTVIDHDRDWIIGCIKHDGFIKTDRFDKANQIILDALLAVQGWIPCSERLPEKTDMYLVTYGNTHGGKVEQMVYPLHYWQKRWMSFDHSWESKTVTAWMPLPKPYKGGDSE